MIGSLFQNTVNIINIRMPLINKEKEGENVCEVSLVFSSLTFDFPNLIILTVKSEQM